MIENIYITLLMFIIIQVLSVVVIIGVSRLFLPGDTSHVYFFSITTP